MSKPTPVVTTLLRSRRTSAFPWTACALGLSVLATFTAGCDRTYVTNNYYEEAPDAAPGPVVVEEPDAAPGPTVEEPDAQAPHPGDSGMDGDSGVDGDAGPLTPSDASTGPQPLEEGAPLVNSTPNDLDLDVFGTFDNRYWFVVSEEEVARMNERYGGGGPIFFFGNDYGDIYSPGGVSDDPTFADHLLVTTSAGKTADYGKVQVNLVGESTGRPWTDGALPNIKVDTNEFVQKNRLGGYEHIRFNNAVVGSIFREKYTLDFYAELGYPAPKATFGWVSSSVWGPDVAVPYVVTEAYKRSFCKNREDYFGGECPNMWEFPGDFGYGSFDNPESCQFSECDSTRVNDLEQLVLETPQGEGYKAALSEMLDWDTFHQFQCLSWIFATGDDALHNTNNFVLVERPDGMFQLLPYSVDIAFGQDWYPYVPLAGQSNLARGCQSDGQCWADTIATCEELLGAFIAADPVNRLDELYAQVEEAGMLRTGDEGRYETMRSYVEQRLEELPMELEENREGPYTNYCDPPFVMCGDYCELPEYCYLCDDGGGVVEPFPMPVPEPRPGVVAAGGDGAPAYEPGDAGVAADAEIVIPPPDGEPQDPPVDPEPEPNPCLPFIQYYEVDAP